MPFFNNPLHKHDVSEFEGVYEPLAEARRHHSVVAAHDGPKDGDSKSDEAKTAESDTGNQYSANTLEGLRTEIDNDVVASGHDTIYDRM